MAVEPRERLIERLGRAAQRMNAIRGAASALRLIRQGPEPEPTALPGELTPPETGFTGQPEGPRETA